MEVLDFNFEKNEEFIWISYEVVKVFIIMYGIMRVRIFYFFGDEKVIYFLLRKYFI